MDHENKKRQKAQENIERHKNLFSFGFTNLIDVNLMHAILLHCYFKAPLFHCKTLSVHDSSIGSSESLSKRTFKMSFD